MDISWVQDEAYCPKQTEVFKNYKVLFSVRAEDLQVQDFGKSPGIVLETNNADIKQRPALNLSLLTARCFYVRENEAVFVFNMLKHPSGASANIHRCLCWVPNPNLHLRP